MSLWIRLDTDFDRAIWLRTRPRQVRHAWVDLLRHIKDTAPKKGHVRFRDAYDLAVSLRYMPDELWIIEELIEAATELHAGDHGEQPEAAIRIEAGFLIVNKWHEYQSPDAGRVRNMRDKREDSRNTVASESLSVTNTECYGNGMSRTTKQQVVTDTSIEVSPPIPPKSSPNELEPLVAEVIGYLNEQAGKKYQITSSTVKPLWARLKACRKDDRQECVRTARLIVDKKISEWGKDPRMRGFIRPETLFAAGHWDTYSQEAHEWDDQGRPSNERTKQNQSRNPEPRELFNRLASA